MAQLLTNRFRIHTILSSVNAIPWRKHMFLARSSRFTNDSAPPVPQENVQTLYIDVYDDMLCTKTIEATDVNMLIDRVDWTSGVVYDEYTHDNPTGMEGKQFYVVVDNGSTYSVFKCLSNNNGIASTYAPDVLSTSASDDIYETADGYQWKFMYSMTNTRFEKFATVEYMPVIVDANVAANAISGSIDRVKVMYGGSGYNNFANGTIQSAGVGGNSQVFHVESTASSNSNFYTGCAFKISSGTGAGQQRIITDYLVSGATRTVVVDTPFTTAPTTASAYEISPAVIVFGNGNTFSGRALINTASSNSIYKVEITDRGQGYNWATATLQGNTAGISNTATLKPIISPQNGHGADPVEELYAKYLCFSVNFDATESSQATDKLINTNDFRTVGIILDPLLANVELTITGGAGTFGVGDIVTQANVVANGTITFANSTTLRLTNVYGNFLTGNSTAKVITGSLSLATGEVTAVKLNTGSAMSGNVVYTNETTRFNITGLSGTFQPDETLTGTGNATTSSASLYFANSSQVWVTQKKGTFGNTLTGITSGATATIVSETPSDMIKGTGDILYIENISPINKSNNQTETVKVVIEY